MAMQLGAFSKRCLDLGDDLGKIGDKLPHFRHNGSIEGYIDAVRAGCRLGCLHGRNQRAQRSEGNLLHGCRLRAHQRSERLDQLLFVLQPAEGDDSPSSKP